MKKIVTQLSSVLAIALIVSAHVFGMEQSKMVEPEVVELKNGKSVPKTVVENTMRNLMSLKLFNYMAYYELVQKARNPAYAIFGNYAEKLVHWGLNPNDQTVMAIVFCAVEGGLFGTSLVSPLKESTSKD